MSLFGGFAFVKKGDIENQRIFVENSSFIENYGSFGGVFHFSANLENITVFFSRNSFIKNGAEGQIFFFTKKEISNF